MSLTPVSSSYEDIGGVPNQLIDMIISVHLLFRGWNRRRMESLFLYSFIYSRVLHIVDDSRHIHIIIISNK